MKCGDERMEAMTSRMVSWQLLYAGRMVWKSFSLREISCSVTGRLQAFGMKWVRMVRAFSVSFLLFEMRSFSGGKMARCDAGGHCWLKGAMTSM